MKTVIRIIGCLALALGMSSCVDITTEVHVKKDGSASIAQAVYMTPAALAMMAQQGGGKPPSLIDEAKLKAMATQMGKGVKFEGAEERKRKDGAQGYIARYSIANVNDLTINESLTSPGAGQGAGQAAQMAKKSKTLRFKFTPGTTPSLAIAIPQEKNSGSVGEDGNQPNDPAAAAMMQQMKSMFEGMRMWVRIRVDGVITETNARHVNPKKTGLTLMKIDFGKLMADEKGFAKFQALGKNPNPDQVRTALKDLPYIQVEDQEVINMKFK